MTQEQFIPLAEEYKDMLFRIALNYYGNPHDADDTVQDVLLKLLCWKRGFESREHARNWLIRVCINQCKNGLRRAKRRQCVPIEEVELPVQFQFPEQGELYQAVMALPRDYRTALYLFYFEELSVAEIAGILGITITAVTTRLSRARKRLKQILTEAECDG